MNLSAPASGYCKKCGKTHKLGPGNSVHHCLILMHQFSCNATIDLDSPGQKIDNTLALSSLFDSTGGKMFGVMECLKPDGSATTIKAFSGQYNGRWLVEGWTPPLFDVARFNAISYDVEQEIKKLGQKITECIPHSKKWLMLRKIRRNYSQQLMRKIHDLYQLANFKGETATLGEAYTDHGGMPAGTGDCCAPKLLNFAAKNNLHPLGITEFYWGEMNRSQTRHHGLFYSSCAEKCQPILGFMLCGLKQQSTLRE